MFDQIRQFLMHFLYVFLPVAEGNINDVLIKTLAEAHANTNPKLEFVHEMFRKPQVIQLICHIIVKMKSLLIYSIFNRFISCFGSSVVK